MIFTEEDGRKWLGKTVLLPDKERGGVTSKTFLNVTFGKCKKKRNLRFTSLKIQVK